MQPTNSNSWPANGRVIFKRSLCLPHAMQWRPKCQRQGLNPQGQGQVLDLRGQGQDHKIWSLPTTTNECQSFTSCTLSQFQAQKPFPVRHSRIYTLLCSHNVIILSSCFHYFFIYVVLFCFNVLRLASRIQLLYFLITFGSVLFKM